MKSVSSLKGIIFVLLSTFVFAGAPDWDCNGDGTLDNFNDYQNIRNIYCSILKYISNTHLFLYLI